MKIVFPDSPSPNTKTHDVAYILINRDEICTAYTDLTVRFPYRSSSGIEYLSIAYHYDGNIIVAKPLKIVKRNQLLQNEKCCIRNPLKQGWHQAHT